MCFGYLTMIRLKDYFTLNRFLFQEELGWSLHWKKWQRRRKRTLILDNMNVTDKNVTSTGDNDSQYQQTALYVSLLLVWLPGIVLNVIALVFITRDIRKAVFPAIVLLFVLCLYDLLAVLFSLCQHLLDRYIDMSDVACSISTFLFSYFVISSGVMNCLMAIDRVMAICAPFYYKRRIEVRTWCVVCCVAGLSTAVFSVFPIIGLGSIWSVQGGRKTCNLGYQEKPIKRVYGMVYGVIGFVFIAVIVAFNVILVRTLFKMKKTIVSVQSSASSDSSIEPKEGTRTTSFEIAFAKLMIGLSIAFIVCGTPTKVGRTSVFISDCTLNVRLSVSLSLCLSLCLCLCLSVSLSLCLSVSLSLSVSLCLSLSLSLSLSLTAPVRTLGNLYCTNHRATFYNE